MNDEPSQLPRWANRIVSYEDVAPDDLLASPWSCRGNITRWTNSSLPTASVPESASSRGATLATTPAVGAAPTTRRTTERASHPSSMSRRRPVSSASMRSGAMGVGTGPARFPRRGTASSMPRGTGSPTAGPTSTLWGRSLTASTSITLAITQPSTALGEPSASTADVSIQPTLSRLLDARTWRALVTPQQGVRPPPSAPKGTHWRGTISTSTLTVAVGVEPALGRGGRTAGTVELLPGRSCPCPSASAAAPARPSTRRSAISVGAELRRKGGE